jgi:hypothetical protein
LRWTHFRILDLANLQNRGIACLSDRYSAHNKSAPVKLNDGKDDRLR